ncbi:hypothetical protein KQI52_08825 [bacterium]|nr:hypothetical protein [bacterium]
MKRTLLLGLIVLVIVSMTGLAVATVWEGQLNPGDYVRQPIMNLGIDGNCQSKMLCWVPVIVPIPHTTLVTYNNASYYYHAADLSYGQRSDQRGVVLLTTATLHWSLGNTFTGTGYSDFVFAW